MRATLLLGLALLSCGRDKASDDSGPATDGADGASDGADGADLDPATVPLAGACDQAHRVGRFKVESNEDYAYAVGEVADGVLPTDVLTLAREDGDCTIWRRENPFCDPSCASGFTCSLEGECVPYPEAQDLGVVTIAGLTTPVSMEPVVPGNAYFDTALDHPPWDGRAVLTLESEGGARPALTLHAVAPDPFTVPEVAWLLVPGEPFTVTWDPPDAGARTEVVLNMRIDQHGLTPSTLSCVFEDDGEGTVPAESFAALVEFGITGFPTGELERRTVDHAVLEGEDCAELVASESRLADLEIEGYTPCRRDEDCPEGQECNEALERCE